MSLASGDAVTRTDTMLRASSLLRCARPRFRHARAPLYLHYSSQATLPPVRLSAEVAEALEENRPVVALESTIVSHGGPTPVFCYLLFPSSLPLCWSAGMPYPQNVETAVEVEAIVRSHGAAPATIAIMDGEVCAGLDADALESLGKLGRDARKCSRLHSCPGAVACVGLTVLGAVQA